MGKAFRLNYQETDL